MALAIVLFVPNGIVMASDGLSEIRNQTSDHEFLQKKQKTLFKSPLGYLICTPCPSFVSGVPLAYYVDLQIMKIHNCQSTFDFAKQLTDGLLASNVPSDNITLYISGYTNSWKQEVLLVDRGNIIKVNESGNSDPVYNYHSIGRSIWMDKLMLHTSSTFEDGQNIEFMPADIDFSKYSIEEAEDFAIFMLKVSRHMDSYAQVNQNIGEFITVGSHELNGKISIRTLSQNSYV